MSALVLVATPTPTRFSSENSAAGTRYAIDLPTPVPASIATCVRVSNASSTAPAISSCSARDSKPAYIRPAMPSAENSPRTVLGVRAGAGDLLGVVERLGLVGGDALAARIAQVEDGAGRGGGDVREDRARRPVGVAREVGEAVQQPGRQVGEPHERDAPHRRKRLARRAARGAAGPLGRDAERLGEVGEAVRAQPRQARCARPRASRSRRRAARGAPRRARGTRGRSSRCARRCRGRRRTRRARRRRASAPGDPRSISSVMPVSLVISAESGTTGSTSVVKVSTTSGPRMMAARDLDDLIAVRSRSRSSRGRRPRSRPRTRRPQFARAAASVAYAARTSGSVPGTR